MKRVNCYACGSSESEFWAEENGFVMVRCSCCGLLYVNPRPDDEEISLALRTGLHRGDAILNMTVSYGGSARVSEYVEIIRDLYGNGFFHYGGFSWLDIGCGYGEFMEALQIESNHEAQIRGSEPSKIKSESARMRGLDVSFADLEEGSQEYDYVSLLNVYSHLPEPVQTIRSIKGLLRKNGELLIQTGDAANLAREDHPGPLYLPDHLSFASEAIVVGILEDLGFDIVDVARRHHPAYPRRDVLRQVRDLIRFIVAQEHRRPGRVDPNRDMWIRSRLRE